LSAVLADRLQQPAAGLGPFSAAAASDRATTAASSSNTPRLGVDAPAADRLDHARAQPPTNTALGQQRLSGTGSSWKDQPTQAGQIRLFWAPLPAQHRPTLGMQNEASDT
jgi:hypothetical protein